MRNILASLALAAIASTAMAAAPPRGGLYDSVTISDVTGDEGGIRIRVHDDPKPFVEFSLCEGACLDPMRFPAKIEGDRISFDYVEPHTDVQGRPSGETRAHVEGRFVAKGLLLKIDFLDSPHDDKNGFSLIPRAKPRS